VNYEVVLTMNSIIGRQKTSIILPIGSKHYFIFLKIALKTRINTIPPMHITRRISGVIWSTACIIHRFIRG